MYTRNALSGKRNLHHKQNRTPLKQGFVQPTEATSLELALEDTKAYGFDCHQRVYTCPIHGF